MNDNTTTILIIVAALLAGLVISVIIGLPFDGKSGSKVFFIQPEDGATVGNPVQLSWGSDNFIIESAGESHAGAGHLHIMIDSPCIPVGQIIPNDQQHLHFGGGQTEAVLGLPPGLRRLCLQMGDGIHRALPLTQEIALTVRGL